MIDRKHFPAIADSARAVLQSLNVFIKTKRVCNAPLLCDELLHEFMVRRRASRQRMIDAGCFEEKERVPVFPLEGPAHAALLTLAADLAGADDRLPREIEAFALRLSAVVDALTAAGTPPVASKKNASDERDKFAYTSLTDGKTLQEIKNKINSKRKWEPLESVQGVSAAAKRYAERHSLPWPIVQR
jgi:hypothetical protein